MSKRVNKSGLSIDAELFAFVEQEALSAVALTSDEFWAGFARIVGDLQPRNRELLAERDRLQAEIDRWHREHPAPIDIDAYRGFLEQIGYLLPEPDGVRVTTADVDDEIAVLAAPQLVVP